MVEIVCIYLYLVAGTAAIPSLWHTLAMCTDDSRNDEESKPDDNPPEQDAQPKEIGGRGGLDPTRYGDWEKAGRCIDF
jgi:hypothetical protein